jgi:hypothetical protein
MKVGDLVETEYGDFGIVIGQVGVTDRWLVRWFNGDVYASWSSNLWRVS